MKFGRRKTRVSLRKELVSALENLPSCAVTMGRIPEEEAALVHNDDDDDDDDENKDPWRYENFAKMSQQWGLTEDDERKMRDLENRLADVDHWKNDPFEVVRFYKELKGNVKAAEEKFRKMVFWRLENNIDSFLARYGEPDPIFDLYPSVMLKGLDKEGDPIFLERTGVFDAYGFYKHFGTKGMMDFVTYKREMDVTRRQDGKGWQHEYYEPKYGKKVHLYTVIMDMDGLNRNHMRAGLLPLLNQMARMVQDYYAGLAKRIIVARAPAIFKVFWSIIKHFFEPHIRELVTFTTHSDYLDVLDKYIDREVLPPQLCPKYGVGGVMPGFEHVRLDGGMLTPDIIEHSRDPSFRLRTPIIDKMSRTSSEADSDSESSGATTSWEDYSCRSLMDDCSQVSIAIRRTSNGCRVVSGVLARGSIVEEPRRRGYSVKLISSIDV